MTKIVKIVAMFLSILIVFQIIFIGTAYVDLVSKIPKFDQKNWKNFPCYKHLGAGYVEKIDLSNMVELEKLNDISITEHLYFSQGFGDKNGRVFNMNWFQKNHYKIALSTLAFDHTNINSSVGFCVDKK